MDEWVLARVEQNEPLGPRLFALTLIVQGADYARQHVRAGQYIRVKHPSAGEGVFVIASAPGETDALTLLVRDSSPLTSLLRMMRSGETVAVSAPGGPGFPVEQARGHDVLMIATGSGIAAVRPVLELTLRHRAEYDGLTLLYGVRSREDFVYGDQVARWEAAGVRVLKVLSRPDAGWTGLRGYVQDHLDRVDVSRAVVFVAGQLDMVQGVTETLVRRGLPATKIFLNH